jgi:regulator of sirC expression with transglutaminase-like and TPR domain
MRDQSCPDYRELFAQQVRLQDAELELDRAALYLAGEDCPDLDVDACLADLSALAVPVREKVGTTTDQQVLADALNHHLFVHLGFTGNTADYYSPDNSFLNRVLATRTGIPITLAVLYLEVGRRLGLGCHGVGLPGHFVVGLDHLGLYLDPFHSGQWLSAADCRRLVRDMFGPEMEWREELLHPCTKRDILFRMLTNLNHIFLGRGEYARAIGVIQRMVLTNPSLPSLYKELAGCRLHLQEYRQAIGDLETYLQTAEDPQDAADVRQQIQAIWSALSRLN